jgi:hypothetical protein
MPRGVHVRGWTGSFTVEGGAGVPALWTRLEDALRRDRLDDLLAAAGPKARSVLLELLDTLDGHDMLTSAPSGEGGAGGAAEDASDTAESAGGAAAADTGGRLARRWFGAVAADPDTALRAVRDADFTVHAAPASPTDRADPLAESVRRSLARLGATDTHVCSGNEPPGQVVLEAAGLAVAVRIRGGTAFVTESAPPDMVRADARALAARLGLDPTPPTPGPLAVRLGPSPTPPAPGLSADQLSLNPAPPAPAPGPLAALVAGAAAQRLVCAVAGLPDPATRGENPRLPEGWPSVLVASADPLHAEYHPWRGRPVPAPATLAEALRTVEALCDERTGLLPAAHPGRLPQLPAALAACDIPGGTLVATAARVDLARLEATCRAAELIVAEPDASTSPDVSAGPLGRAAPETSVTRDLSESTRFPVTVGMNRDHAVGRALRALALALPLDGAQLVTADEWMPDRHARHWWQSLTIRLGVSALPSVYRLADGVFRAEVRSGRQVTGRAVEATAADAMAFAALAATGLAQTPPVVQGRCRHVAPSGAIAALAASGAAVSLWEGPGSTAVWLGDVADRQGELCDRLGRLVGPVCPWRSQRTEPLWEAGLTVLAPGGGG